jgi:hypothetical protein
MNGAESLVHTLVGGGVARQLWGNLTPSRRPTWTAGVELESGPSLEMIEDRDF